MFLKPVQLNLMSAMALQHLKWNETREIGEIFPRFRNVIGGRLASRQQSDATVMRNAL